MELNDFNYNYEIKYTDDSNNSNDRWQLYLFKGFKKNLRNRLEEMISHSEYELFFTALKMEYGYNVQKDLDQAFLLYKETSIKDSTNYLSMARLFEIYKTKDKKFIGKIENDKNLELIYLFKSFAYLPIYILRDNSFPNLFPLDLPYIVASFMDYNQLPNTKNISLYIDKLMQSGKYSDILSIDDGNLIKGFIESFFDYQFEENNTKAIDSLLALSLEGNSEASSKLIYIYLESLNKIDKKDNKNKDILKKKIFELFETLEQEKCYKIYGQYGLFLYHEMHMFDKALEIFEEGYNNNMYECAFCYFHAFTKSENQITLDNMFDYLHIMGKKYNLMNQFSNRYMIYLNEIALICKSFFDKEKAVENIKKFTLYDIDLLKYSSYHALSVIYMYGLTTEVQLNLLKADKYLKKAMEKDEYSQPYYSRLRYKNIKKC